MTKAGLLPIAWMAIITLSSCVGYRTAMDDASALPVPATPPTANTTPDAKPIQFPSDTGTNVPKPDTNTISPRLDAGTDLPKADTSTPLLKPDSGVDLPLSKLDVGMDVSKLDVGTDQRRPDAGSDLLRPDTGTALPRPDTNSDLPRPDAGSDVLAVDARRTDASLPDTSPPFVMPPLGNCTPGSPYVLVLGEDGLLYRFDSTSLSLTTIARVSCTGPAGIFGDSSLNSMTVSPLGPAYISNQSGDLCVVDTTTFKAKNTAFNSLLLDESYGMALLPDSSQAGQTLYIATNSGNILHRIDLTTLALTRIGPITPTVDSTELTAGPNAGLYGFAVGSYPALLLTIDATTGQATDVTKVPAGPYAGASFALVNWQGDFYLFVGVNASQIADVFRYHKGDPEVSHLGTVPVGIIGAGVAMCPAALD